MQRNDNDNNPKCEQDENGVCKQIGELASEVGGALGKVGVIGKGVGQPLPEQIGKAGKGLKIIGEALKDLSPNWVEKAACGAAKIVVQGAVGGAFVVKGAAEGANAVGIPHPAAKAAGAAAGAYFAGKAAGPVVDEVGKAGNKGCHAAFDFFREKPGAEQQQQKQQHPMQQSPKQQNQSQQTQQQQKEQKQQGAYASPQKPEQQRAQQQKPEHKSQQNAEQNPEQNAGQKPEQNKSAEKKVAAAEIRNQALNPHEVVIQAIPLARENAVHAVYRPHEYNYFNQPRTHYLPFNFQHELRAMFIGSNLSFSDRMYLERIIDRACFYASFQMSMGYSFVTGLQGFGNSLSAAGLLNSYNMRSLMYSMVRDAAFFYGEPGGIVMKGGLFTNMINSEAQAIADEYYICLRKSSALSSDKMEKINQILRELTIAWHKYQTTPFVSIDFNKNKYIYVIMHSYFKGTLTGQIVAFLDYWMKGFLNGGVYPEKFLKAWAKTLNCDENYLRQNMIDLKKYAKEMIKDLNYMSLREIEYEAGVKSESDLKKELNQQRNEKNNAATNNNDNQAKTLPFETSYRILANIEQVQQFGNVIIPVPRFTVKYTLHLKPDLKAFFEKYYQENGEHHKDYKNIIECYEKAKYAIEEKMPKFPIFQEYFELLGVMVSFCYMIATLDKMGKCPALPEQKDEVQNKKNQTQDNPYAVPEGLPPQPVRKPVTVPVNLTLGQILNHLTGQEIQELDAMMYYLFEDRNIDGLPEKAMTLFQRSFMDLVNAIMLKHLKPKEIFEFNVDQIEKMCRTTQKFIYQNIIQFHVVINNKLSEIIKVCDDKIQLKIDKLPMLSEKIRKTQNLLNMKINFLENTWKQKSILSIKEILDAFTPEWKEIFSKNIAKINKKIAEKIIAHTHIEFKKQKNELRIIKRKLEEEAVKVKQLITSLEQNKANQLASIPQHLRTLNQENINSFVASQDEKIRTLTEYLNGLPCGLLKLKTDPANTSFTTIEPLLKNIPAVILFKDKLFYANIKNKTITAIPLTSKNNYFYTQLISKFTSSYKKSSTDQERNLISLITDHPVGVTEKLTFVMDDLMALRENIKQIPELMEKDIADIKNNYCKHIISVYQKNEIESKQKSMKTEALRFLKLFNTNETERLNEFLKQIQHFSITMKSIPALANHVLARNYVHMILAFTGPELQAITGDLFNIIGGCSLQLPNISTRPMEHGNAFTEALENAVITNSNNRFTEFTFNHQDYFSICLPVKEIRDEDLLDKQNNLEVQQAFLDIVRGKKDVADLLVSDIQASLDPAGATLVHYAAALLNDQEFNLIADKASPLSLVLPDAYGNTPFHFAAREGNLTVMKTILAKNIPGCIENKNTQNITPLILAIQGKQLEAVKLLIQHNANVNDVLINGLFPLYIAIQCKATAIIDWLIDNVVAIDLNIVLKNKMTALHLAIEQEDWALADKLIIKGASCMIHRDSDGYTALHSAVKRGRIELIKRMHEKNVKLDIVIESGKSPLHIAAEANQKSCVEYLMASCKDNIDLKTQAGDTALMLAIKAGNVDVAKMLAEKSTVDLVDSSQRTASLLCLQYGMASVADILIEKGENPQKRDKYGYDYIYYLVRNGEFHRFQHLLINPHRNIKNIDIRQKYHGQNLLEIAAKSGQFLIVYELEDKIQLNDWPLLHYAVAADEIGYVRDNANTYDLFFMDSLANLAAARGSNRCLAWLLSCLDWLLRPKMDNKVLLKNAIESGNSKTVEMIIKRCDVNLILDEKNNTAIHLAATYGLPEIISLLLKSGSDVTLRNKDNYTAFHLSVIQEDNACLKRLFTTTSEEWPVDLWQEPMTKPSSTIKKTLEIYRKRLVIRPGTNSVTPFSSSEKKTNELPEIIMDENFTNALHALKNLFKTSQFNEAANILEKNRKLLKLFQSRQGASLFQMIFSHLYDPAAILAVIKKENEDINIQEKDIQTFIPHRLFTLLKKHHIYPELYKGKDNVLLVLIHSDSDAEASYRLKVLKQYYPDSIAALATDEIADVRMIELAAKLKKKNLFRELIHACKQTKNIELPELEGLHEAVNSQDYDLVVDMLKLYSVNAVNKHRQTPLMLAAALNNVRIMEMLIEKGAMVEQVDKLGNNALHYALQDKGEAAALFLLPLLKEKSMGNRKGVTPLMMAASKGCTSIIRYFCENKDNSQIFDRKGWNALHHAAYDNQPAAIAVLHHYGFDLNTVENPASRNKIQYCRKRTALHIAANFGQSLAVRKLIELGANLELEDTQQYSVCEYAVQGNDVETLQLLQSGDYPLARASDEKIISFYDTRDNQLLLASAVADNEIVAGQLILKGVSINVTNKSGETTLHIAAKHNASKVLDLLLQGGNCLTNATDSTSHTALQYAAFLGHVRPIELLCRAGANINYKASHAPTALFMACQRGHIGAVTMLLKYQADLTITNHEKITPAQIALFHAHFDIVRQLQYAGDRSINKEAISELPALIQEGILKNQAVLQSVAIKATEGLRRNGLYRAMQHDKTAPTHSSFKLGK